MISCSVDESGLTGPSNAVCRHVDARDARARRSASSATRSSFTKTTTEELSTVAWSRGEITHYRTSIRTAYGESSARRCSSGATSACLIP